VVVPNKVKVTSPTSSKCGGLDFQNHPPEYTVEFCNCMLRGINNTERLRKKRLRMV